MKSMRYFILLVIGLFDINLISLDNHQLSHICAYSNESVVRFRAATLKSQKLLQINHPGIQLDWPIDLCEFWISSLYGLRKNPSGGSKMHYGVDMAAFKGTTVKVSADGIVKSVNSSMPGYGNVVDVQHKNGLVTRYAHLISMDVIVGQKVKKGQVLGCVGATGNVRGVDPSHLHFEIIKQGERIDPLKYLYSAEIGYKNLKK